jgi:hypothetical protein
VFFAANAWRGGWQHCKAAIGSVQFYSIDLDFGFWILNFEFWILDFGFKVWILDLQHLFFLCFLPPKHGADDGNTMQSIVIVRKFSHH